MKKHKVRLTVEFIKLFCLFEIGQRCPAYSIFPNFHIVWLKTCILNTLLSFFASRAFRNVTVSLLLRVATPW